MMFHDFMDRLRRFGLEFFNKYYGPYKAIVVDNKDPQGQGRVQVKCPRALLTEFNGIWILPMMHGAGSKKGVFWPPDIGDATWIFFDNGDPTRPLGYMGGWYGLEELDAELGPAKDGTPQRRGFMTPGGQRIILDDTPAGEQITIQNSEGQRIQITRNKVKIGSKDGVYEPMLKGSTVQRWLETHSHTHPQGPTGTPIQPFPANGLSDDVEGT